MSSEKESVNILTNERKKEERNVGRKERDMEQWKEKRDILMTGRKKENM